KPHPRLGVVGVEGDRALQTVASRWEKLGIIGTVILACMKDAVICVEAVGTLPHCSVQTSPRDYAVGLGDPTHDMLGDLVLDVKDAFGCKLAVKALRPLMGTRRGVSELHSHADRVGSLPHASFEDILDAQVFTDFPHINRFALVLEGRVTRDDEQFTKLGESGDDLLRDAVAEILQIGSA